jgi:hypothetical protein
VHGNDPFCILLLHKADGDFVSSRTLQELLAPRDLRFFDSKWQSIGTKSDPEIAKRISDVIGIQEDVLEDPLSIFHYSIAQRMSWAAKRQATRAEDIAYALLGLFNINMPMQYGEGAAAFVRLQKEIMKTTNDQSLFAWGYGLEPSDGRDVNSNYDKKDPFEGYPEDREYSEDGMFADHPNRFANGKSLVFLNEYCRSTSFSEANGAVYMDMPLLSMQDLQTFNDIDSIGFLPCADQDNPEELIGILLERWTTNNLFVRKPFSENSFTCRVKSKLAAKAKMKTICISNSAPWRLLESGPRTATGWRRTIVVHFDVLGEVLQLISSPNSGRWVSEDMTLHIPLWVNRPQMRFEVASQYQKSTLWFKVCHDIIPSLHEKPRDHVVITTLQDNEDIGERVHVSELRVAASEAALLQPDAKIEVATKSHIVFNHVITDMRITVRRYV